MKTLFASLLLAVSLLPLVGHTQTAEKYQAGKHYQVIAVPVRTTSQDKIEVNEVFWYGCPHCWHFEEVFEPWAKKQPADVDVQRTPAMWRPNMESHARVYYVAKQLNVLDTMQPIIFKAMQEEKKTLANENEVAALFAEHGLDEAAARKAYNSFSVQSQVKQADARVRSYGITGTPQLVINGKYLIGTSRKDENDPNSVEITQADMLDIASYLIEKERQSKK